MLSSNILQRTSPLIVAHLLPAFNDFRAFDDYSFAACHLIGNALGIRLSATRWIDKLAVHTVMDSNHLAGLGKLCRGLNGFKRFARRAVASVIAGGCDMEFRRRSGRGKHKKGDKQGKRFHCGYSLGLMTWWNADRALLVFRPDFDFLFAVFSGFKGSWEGIRGVALGAEVISVNSY